MEVPKLLREPSSDLLIRGQVCQVGQVLVPFGILPLVKLGIRLSLLSLSQLAILSRVVGAQDDALLFLQKAGDRLVLYRVLLRHGQQAEVHLVVRLVGTVRVRTHAGDRPLIPNKLPLDVVGCLVVAVDEEIFSVRLVVPMG